MKISEFWNHAFLAALTRLAVEEARKEADLATDVCTKHWREQRYTWARHNIPRWQDQDIEVAYEGGHVYNHDIDSE